MISTKDLSCMPEIENLRRICKGISALEIIMSGDWEMRYYSYIPDWDEGEEVFEMRDGGGRHMLVLFRPEGCVISGIDGEYYDAGLDAPKIENITLGLPEAFREFMFGEPVKSLKSTFCVWRTGGDTKWRRGDIHETQGEDGSEEMLDIFDPNLQKYVDFCKWYYESEPPLDIVRRVYEGEPLTFEMVKRLNGEREDMEPIREELCEIGYPNTLS